MIYSKMVSPPGINALLRRYRSAGDITPQQFIQQTYDRIEQCIEPDLWITLTPLNEVLQRVTALTQEFSKSLPLYGIPFIIHDKTEIIDPLDRSAQVIKNLLAAGAIPIGKINKPELKSSALEFVNFVLGINVEGGDLRSTIFALTDSDVEIILKNAGESPSIG